MAGAGPGPARACCSGLRQAAFTWRTTNNSWSPRRQCAWANLCSKWGSTVAGGRTLVHATPGSGEWLLGLAAFVRYDPGLLWITLVAVFLQTVFGYIWNCCCRRLRFDRGLACKYQY